MERADDEAAGRYRARLYAAREKAAGATEERDQAVKERDEAKGEGDSLALAHEKGGLGPVSGSRRRHASLRTAADRPGTPGRAPRRLPTWRSSGRSRAGPCGRERPGRRG